MTTFSRRAFGKAAGAFGLAALTEHAAAPSGARIVIIGGGPGGATVAALLKQGASDLQVTLIEARPVYPTCFYSNLYLGGFRSYASLLHGYDGLRALGVKTIAGTAAEVDTTRKSVSVVRGRPISYDRLVVAPGIALKYEAIEGYSEEAAGIMPHAWNGGPQIQLLKRQLAAMPNGGTVVLTAPALPYRCPPAPYERACMVAHYLKMHKPRSKIILLDAKRSFIKQAAFEDAFATLYKGQIELALSNEIDDNTVVRVDTRTGEVVTRSGRNIKADVANIVPPQRAGDIAKAAGLADGDWCPVNFDSFKSTKAESVYVLGDAAIASDMPKSAFAANNQAHAVAAGILADVAGKERQPARYRNTCWSMLGPDDSVKVGANYAPGLKEGKPALVASDPFVSATGESAAVRRQTFEESAAWYDSLTSEAFPRPAPGTPKTPAEPARHRRRRG